MEFKEIQEKVVLNAENYGKNFNVTIDKEFAVLKLVEEVGEFAEALLIHQKKSRPEKHLSEDESRKRLGRELADVVGMAMVNAHLLEIDLEKSLDEKWITNQE